MKPGDGAMADKSKPSVVLNRLAVLTAAAIFFIGVTVVGSHAAEIKAGNQHLIASSELPRRPSSVVKLSQLVADGMHLGMVVLYDDPATSRDADYLELYDSDGGLVAAAWFDRYGIERIAMDRAFVEGKDRLEGVFITVVDGDLM
jgi:hypothetical protein